MSFILKKQQHSAPKHLKGNVYLERLVEEHLIY